MVDFDNTVVALVSWPEKWRLHDGIRETPQAELSTADWSEQPNQLVQTALDKSSTGENQKLEATARGGRQRRIPQSVYGATPWGLQDGTPTNRRHRPGR